MFSWLISKHVKKEVKEHLNGLHLHLSNSFSNIRGDITNIHQHLNHKEKKLVELERKISVLENRLLYFFQSREEPERTEPSKQELESIEEPSQIYDLTNITFTQQTILVAIYELQIRLNSPISFKSLAKYLYPGKKYSAVRTTLSEYIELLSTFNFVKKDKVSRESVAIITKKGEKLAKEIIKKERLKKKLKIETE